MSGSHTRPDATAPALHVPPGPTHASSVGSTHPPEGSVPDDEQRHDLGTGGGVEVARGLVGKQQHGIVVSRLIT
jgi:hypothetical protein